MSNQVVLDSPVFLIKTAQEQVLRTFRHLVEIGAPRDFTAIIRLMGDNPLYNLILKGEDTLAKAALLSGINAYRNLGPDFNTSNFSRMNLAASVSLLERVDGFPQDIAREARAAGHTQLIIKARQA